jgi:hypothetical protein
MDGLFQGRLRPYLLAAIALLLAHSVFHPASANAVVNDECEFIRKFISQAAITGGKLQLAPRVYNCRAMVLINKSHIEITGAGQDRTVLRLADHSPAPVLVIGDDKVIQNEKGEWVPATRVTDVRVSELAIDGNLEHQDSSMECGNHGCDGDVASIRNNGITIRGASDISLENVTSHSNISGGMVTEKYCYRLHVKNFKSFGNHFDGFAGYQTEDSVFENMDLSHNRAAGISLDIDFAKNRFSGGRLEDNGDVGIFARDIRNVVFEHLAIRRSGNHGAFLSEVEGPETCPNDNEFKDVTVENSKGWGIHLASNCTGNRITGHSLLRGNRDGCYFAPAGAVIDVDKSVRCINARSN